MKKGQYVRILSMCGEPQMSGKIGQYEMTDGIGQIHGTWGPAIQPDKDSYELLSYEEAVAIWAKEDAEEGKHENEKSVI